MSRDARAEWTDEQFERTLAAVLRAGVLIAATAVAIGGAIYLANHARLVPQYRVFRSEPEELRSVRGTLLWVRHLKGTAIIQLGVLLLIATPIVRVIFSIVGFARQRDWLYVGVTLIVLLLLGYSLTTG